MIGLGINMEKIIVEDKVRSYCDSRIYEIKVTPYGFINVLDGTIGHPLLRVSTDASRKIGLAMVKLSDSLEVEKGIIQEGGKSVFFTLDEVESLYDTMSLMRLVSSINDGGDASETTLMTTLRKKAEESKECVVETVKEEMVYDTIEETVNVPLSKAKELYRFCVNRTTELDYEDERELLDGFKTLIEKTEEKQL